MHIPDGFLSTPVWLTLDVAAVPVLSWLARKAQKEVQEYQVPLMGVMGAFVFAAQMINFPVGPGTSNHVVGGALLCVTLGPAAAAMVMTAILALQALVFQDGGILALGANVFNMAFAGVLAGYLPYRILGRGKTEGIGVFLGGFCSVLFGALLALVELLLSGVAMHRAVIGVSLGLFLLTAIMEGAITLAVYQALRRINPGWIRKPVFADRPLSRWVAGAAVLLVAAAGLASSSPDVLEHILRNSGIEAKGRALIMSPLSDYKIGTLGPTWISATMAGIAGLLLIYCLCVGVARLFARRRSA